MCIVREEVENSLAAIGHKHISKYLRKRFLLECSSRDFICGKCSRPAYPATQSASSDIQSHNTNNVRENINKTLCPPSVCLKISSATKSHAYCFICKKPGPKIIVVPAKLRTDVFLKHNILITADSRCCPAHLNSTLDSFDPKVISEMSTIDHAYLNRTTILDLLYKIRQLALKSSTRGMSFDDVDSYSDDDLVNLTGLNKEQFLDLYKYVQPHVKNTPARTARQH